MDGTQLDQKLSGFSGSTDTPIRSGDQKITKIDILSSQVAGALASFPIAPGTWTELNLYEDIFSNFLKGNITIVDNTGLMETLPIIGEEFLEIEMETPGSSPAGNLTGPEPEDIRQEVIKSKFRIVSVQNITSSGERTQIYMLNFVSPEYITNLRKKVQKCYPIGKSGQIISDIVKDVYLDYLSDPPNSKYLYVEDTIGMHSYAFPSFTPLQAMNFLSARAVSSNGLSSGSVFVFYELFGDGESEGSGFRFDSLETLMSKDSKAVYYYRPKNIKSDLGKGDFFNVEVFEVVSLFDTLGNLHDGMYVNRLITHDIVRMKYDTIDYNYIIPTTLNQRVLEDDVVEESQNPTVNIGDRKIIKDDFSHLERFSVGPDMFNKMNTDHLDAGVQPDPKSNPARVSLYSTNKDHDVLYNPVQQMFSGPPSQAQHDPTATPPISKDDSFREAGIQSNKVEKWLLQRQVQLKQLSNIKLRFTVSGNTSRHVGDVIEFRMPTTQKVEDTINEHQFYGGRYLILSIRHRFTTVSHHMDLEVAKDSFYNKLDQQFINDPSSRDPMGSSAIVDGQVKYSEDGKRVIGGF